jgi:hypothetical protein
LNCEKGKKSTISQDKCTSEDSKDFCYIIYHKWLSTIFVIFIIFTGPENLPTIL